MKYPNLLRRYLSSLIDGFALWCIVYGFAKLQFLTHGGSLVFWALGLLLLFYEPVLTAYACTLGQAVMRIRVRTQDGSKRVGLAHAFARMVVKYLLGIISFMTVPARMDRRAIHDLAAGSIVVEATTRGAG